MITLAELVKEAFENAAENGYTFEGMTDAEIVTDMMTCDALLELQSEDDVLEQVRLYRMNNGIPSA
jgi:hypothetical protein